jgi:Autochaperone Domain Type 1
VGTISNSNSAAIGFGNGGMLKATGAVTNKGMISMSAPSQTLGATVVTNNGIINTVAPTPIPPVTNVATIAGNYVGGGALLNLAAAPQNTGGTRADLVQISGSASGTTTVNLTRVVSPALFSTPIPLVIVSGGANSNAFQLASANTTNPIGQ